MSLSTEYVKLLSSGGKSNHLNPEGSNFASWKSSLKSALTNDGTDSALTAAEPPIADAAAHAIWKKKSDAVAFSLRLLMDEEIKSGARMEMGAKELWESLEEEFVRVGPALANKAVQGMMSFEFPVDTLKGFREFETLLSRAKALPGDQVASFVSDPFVVNHLLHRLGPHYSSFLTVFLGTHPDTTSWTMRSFKSALTLEVQSQVAVIDQGISPGTLLRASSTSKCHG